MQKFVVIGGFVLVLGVVLFVFALSFRGWDIRKVSSRQPYEEKSYTASSHNQSIVLKDYNMSVNVGVSGDSDIHLTYFENDKEYYVIEDGAELRIERKNEYHWYDYVFNVDFQSPKFTLLIPKDYKGQLNLTTSNGRIALEDISTAGAELKTSNGHIEVINISNAGDITADTSNGSVSISEIKLNGSLTVNSSNGSIEIDSLTAKSIKADTSNSRITVKQVSANDDMILHTSNGQISITNINAGNMIDLKTGNSSIKGTISGRAADYTIKSDTSNGSNNLPGSMKGGDKKLNVHTSNGSISVEFTD